MHWPIPKKESTQGYTLTGGQTALLAANLPAVINVLQDDADDLMESGRITADQYKEAKDTARWLKMVRVRPGYPMKLSHKQAVALFQHLDAANARLQLAQDEYAEIGEGDPAAMAEIQRHREYGLAIQKVADAARGETAQRSASRMHICPTCKNELHQTKLQRDSLQHVLMSYGMSEAAINNLLKHPSRWDEEKGILIDFSTMSNQDLFNIEHQLSEFTVQNLEGKPASIVSKMASAMTQELDRRHADYDMLNRNRLHYPR